MQLPLGEPSQYPFLVAPVALLESPDLTLAEKLVALALCSLCDRHGRYYSTQAVLAARASVTLRTVVRALSGLIDKGVIRVDGDGYYIPFMDVFGTYTPDSSSRPQPLVSPDAPASEEVTRVFDYWKERLGHPRAYLTNLRRDKIAKRLREGLSEDDARRIIDICADSPFHRGKNDQNLRYDTIERHLFVSRERVEWWLSQDETTDSGSMSRIRNAVEAMQAGCNEEDARRFVNSNEELDAAIRIRWMGC